jgi:hypothetical protein
MQPRLWPEPDPQVAAAVASAYRGKRGKQAPPLAVVIRDRLGQWLADEQFASVFGVRGAPGISPSQLSLVTVLQKVEKMTDRAAADAVRSRLDWKYLLGLPIGDAGFDHTVLSEYRGKVAAGGTERVVFDALLAKLAGEGLVGAGGKQRTDSTHVIAAVATLNRLELVGESVRAAVEALAVAHPRWVSQALCVDDWMRRYGEPMTSWRPPVSQAKREELALAYARDGYALLEAVADPACPPWLAEIPVVQTLRTVLVQNYTRTITGGREVVKRRESEPEGDGLPPGHLRIISPYDTDARWGVKRDMFWPGYKVHITETCDDEPACTCPPGHSVPGQAVDQRQRRHAGGCAATRPNLITNVATMDATVSDAVMNTDIHTALARRGLLPTRHYEDSGYGSTQAVIDAWRQFGVVLMMPVLGDTSAAARSASPYERARFTFDHDKAQGICPQGQASSSWSPTTQRGREVIVVKWAKNTCRPCPFRDQCTRSARGYRQITIGPAEFHQVQQQARADEKTASWQADYNRRAGIEGTISQAARAGARRASYRGLAKTRLEHLTMAVALNLVRLEAHWNGHPLDRRRTTHLARVDLGLAA